MRRPIRHGQDARSRSSASWSSKRLAFALLKIRLQGSQDVQTSFRLSMNRAHDMIWTGRTRLVQDVGGSRAEILP
jgi:hypothetical protein